MRVTAVEGECARIRSELIATGASRRRFLPPWGPSPIRAPESGAASGAASARGVAAPPAPRVGRGRAPSWSDRLRTGLCAPLDAKFVRHQHLEAVEPTHGEILARQPDYWVRFPGCKLAKTIDGGRGESVKGGEKPDQRAEQNTATATVGVRWSEGVGIRLEAAGAGNAGRA